jgi:hypothetical protein
VGGTDEYYFHNGWRKNKGTYFGKIGNKKVGKIYPDRAEIFSVPICPNNETFWNHLQFAVRKNDGGRTDAQKIQGRDRNILLFYFENAAHVQLQHVH